jgi:hypothetical protein
LWHVDADPEEPHDRHHPSVTSRVGETVPLVERGRESNGERERIVVADLPLRAPVRARAANDGARQRRWRRATTPGLPLLAQGLPVSGEARGLVPGDEPFDCLETNAIAPS